MRIRRERESRPGLVGTNWSNLQRPCPEVTSGAGWGIGTLVLLVLLLFAQPIFYPVTNLVSDEANRQEIAAKAKQALSQLPKIFQDTGAGEDFWTKVRAIELLGKDIQPVIEQGLRSPEIPIRLASAKISFSLGAKQEAILTLLAILKDESQDNALGQRAAGALLVSLVKDATGYGDQDAIAESVEDLLDEVLDPPLRLSLARALYYINSSLRGVKELQDLLTLKDPELRYAAALSLAEMGFFEKATDLLEELALEPTGRGQLARTFLEYKRLQDAYERKTTPKIKYQYDYQILEEILDLIKEYYADPARFKTDTAEFDPKDLLTAAAKGIANSLDRFSGYQDKKEKKLAQESIHKKYGGIGAYVNMRDKVLTIERPIYGGPAYKAKLRSFDKITGVEGEPTKGKDINELVSKLKGEPGTPVRIKVYRRGWAKEREFILIRAFIEIKTARGKMLPGDIGFLSLTSFGMDTAKEMKAVLDDFQKNNMQLLIIDLRRNSGGLLRSVVQILDLLLEKGKLIVTTRDKDGTILEKYHTRSNRKIDCPIYVLIDNGSASASEILAGVLQDHKKAILIGERTFGKGSVQSILPLKSTGQKTALRLTIAKYYLPSGRCIHKEGDQAGGVEPDIKIPAVMRDFWKDFAFNKVYDSGELDKYFQQHDEDNRDLFRQLAEDDGRDYTRYPGFPSFYEGLRKQLKIHLDEEDVRGILRGYIRRKVQDEIGKEFIIDLQNDKYLQRAIIEALKQLNIDPETIPQYKLFAHKFEQDAEDEVISQPEKPAQNDTENSDTK